MSFSNDYPHNYPVILSSYTDDFHVSVWKCDEPGVFLKFLPSQARIFIRPECDKTTNIVFLVRFYVFFC